MMNYIYVISDLSFPLSRGDREGLPIASLEVATYEQWVSHASANKRPKYRKFNRNGKIKV